MRSPPTLPSPPPPPVAAPGVYFLPARVVDPSSVPKASWEWARAHGMPPSAGHAYVGHMMSVGTPVPHVWAKPDKPVFLGTGTTLPLHQLYFLSPGDLSSLPYPTVYLWRWVGDWGAGAGAWSHLGQFPALE